jgi:hypothetical protein
MTPALLPLLVLVAAPESTRWYDRPACQKALEVILAADLDEADRKIKPLEASSDAEDQACGVWLRATLAETQISVGGRLPALLENREKVLLRMFKFAKSHASERHLADLEIEARMRRVRALVDKGERTDALKEINRTKELLAQRKDSTETPTQKYVAGIVNSAVSQSGFPMKVVLGIAGVSGDADQGRQHLKDLAAGTSIYRYDAMYILHHFSRESPSKENGAPIDYSKPLFSQFPTNPQFAYDLAVDLYEAKRCKDSLDALTDTRKKLAEAPNQWSSTVRAKLYYITGRCSFDVGDKATAKRYAELAKSQNYEDLADPIDDLIEQL